MLFLYLNPWQQKYVYGMVICAKLFRVIGISTPSNKSMLQCMIPILVFLSRLVQKKSHPFSRLPRNPKNWNLDSFDFWKIGAIALYYSDVLSNKTQENSNISCLGLLIFSQSCHNFYSSKTTSTQANCIYQWCTCWQAVIMIFMFKPWFFRPVLPYDHIIIK